MSGWLRPLKRDAWVFISNAQDWVSGARRVVSDWRNWHRFMSTQALGLGTATMSVGIALGWSPRALVSVLIITAVMTLAGSLIEQPEVDSD